MTKKSINPSFGEKDPSEHLSDMAEEGESAAQRIADAFEEAGQAISDALLDAARTGELNFSQMAEAILQDLARIALELIVIDPINAMARQLGDSVGGSIADVIGQRQAGGPVMAGAPYLVGEQGPEVFVPTLSGSIAPTGPAQVINITIQAQGDAVGAVQRSERQISAAIARAAAAGGRLL